jgi:hypothetical protein
LEHDIERRVRETRRRTFAAVQAINAYLKPPPADDVPSTGPSEG